MQLSVDSEKTRNPIRSVISDPTPLRIALSTHNMESQLHRSSSEQEP